MYDGTYRGPGFTAAFPQAPQVTHHTETLSGKALTTDTYAAELPWGHFVVSHVKPFPLEPGIEREQLTAGVKSHLAASKVAFRLTDSALTINGAPAIAFVGSAPGVAIVGRAVARGTDFYLVLYQGKNGDDLTANYSFPGTFMLTA